MKIKFLLVAAARGVNLDLSAWFYKPWKERENKSSKLWRIILIDLGLRKILIIDCYLKECLWKSNGNTTYEIVCLHFFTGFVFVWMRNYSVFFFFFLIIQEENYIYKKINLRAQLKVTLLLAIRKANILTLLLSCKHFIFHNYCGYHIFKMFSTILFAWADYGIDTDF